MTNIPQRLSYIDVAKGLLILAMIWYHTPIVINRFVPGAHPMLGGVLLPCTNFLLEGFFMPAFFIITGYCSRFSDDRKIFYSKMLKTIILPVSVVTYATCCLIDQSFSPLHFLGPFKPSGNWFILTLLVGRTLYYECTRYVPNRWHLLAVLSVLSLIAMALNENSVVPNPFYWKNGLCAALFIGIGHNLKNVNITQRAYLTLTVAFVCLLILIGCTGIHMPVLLTTLRSSWYEFPLFVTLALSGTALVIWLSKGIGELAFLEYIGRNSLIMYLVQWSALKKIAEIMSPMINIERISGCLLLCVSLFVFANLICLIFVYFFNTKYGLYLLGKYKK